MVRVLRDHADLLRQWSTLVMPSQSDAGPDLNSKEIASALADLIGRASENWMTDLTSYHSDRAHHLFDVRICQLFLRPSLFLLHLW